MLKKKGIAWILMLIMLVSIFATACSKGADTTSDSTANTTTTAAGTETTAEATTAEPVDEGDGSGLPDTDLGGYVFTVADNDASRWFPDAGSSDLAKAVTERIDWIQKKFNCKIEIRNHTEEEFATAVMAGDKYADIIVTYSWELPRHIKAKRLVDMNTIPNLRLDADYWNQYNSTSYLSYGGKVFANSAPFISQNDEVWVIAFNKAIINELGLENPYDLVKNKQWTFEKMLEMQQAAKRDLNGDGVFDNNDRYGLATGHDWDISVALYLASGNKIIDVKDDGTMSYAVNTPKAYETIDMIKKMCKRGDTFFPKGDGEDMDAYVKAFTEGKVLFLAYSRARGVLDPIYEMKDDFGFIPMPMGNNTDDYKCWVNHNAPALAVPVSNPDLDKTGLILEALAWKSQDEDEIRLNEIAYTQLRDDESAEILKGLSKYSISDMAFIGQQMDGAIWQGLNVLPTCGFYDQTQEPASQVAAIEEQVAIGLENVIKMFKGEWVEPPPAEESTE